MNVKRIEKIDWKHTDAILVLADIEQHLKESVMAFDSLKYPNDSRVVVLDLKNSKDEQMITICRINKSLNGDTLNVNEITSIYGKEKFVSLLIKTYEADITFYKNKKTELFIHAFSTYLPQDLNRTLSTSYSRQSFTKSQYEQDAKKCRKHL